MATRVASTLTAKYAEVAATWDDAANGGPCPDDLKTSSTDRVWWRCPAGHRWREPVNRRMALEPWKHDDRAACRVCNGQWLEVTYACGHTVGAPPQKARPKLHCPACWEVEKERREAAWRQGQIEGRARAAELKPQCQADARALADQAWAEFNFDRLPAVLHRVALKELRAAITYDLMGERAFGRQHGAKVVPLLEQLIALAELDLDAPVLGLNAHGRGSLPLLNHTFWAPALTTASVELATSEPETVAALMQTAAEALRLDDEEGQWLAADWRIEVAYDHDPDAPMPRRLLTHHVTRRLKSWAYGCGYRAIGELQVPLADERAFGRLDLVVFRPEFRDIVIEIDSRNVDRSVAKLELARDRGALPVWLRWQSGGLPHLDGVTVVDLRDSATVSRPARPIPSRP